MLVTIFGVIYGITLDIDVGTEVVYLDGSCDCSNHGKLEGLLLQDSLGSNDGKVLGSYEETKILLFDNEVLGTMCNE